MEANTQASACLTMNEQLDALLKEIQAFGVENDREVTDHAEKMLNITPDTGEFLLLLVHALHARRILELGTSNGYSTLWLARAVQPSGGSVTTVELLLHKAERARANFTRAGLDPLIELQIADAGIFLKEQRPESFDFIFLDADRSQYVAWWQDLQKVLVPGGLMVVDNAVSHANEIEGFVQAVHQTHRYITSLVPVGKGELLILKESQVA
jgi:predicted O-methyltransferase YrrM